MPRRNRFTHVKNGERKKQAVKIDASKEFDQLHALVKEVLKNGWVDLTDVGTATIHLCKCAVISRHSYDLIIEKDFTWALYIHGRKVNCEVLGATNLLTTIEKVKELLKNIAEAIVCPGNPDERFIEMITSRKRQMTSTDGDLVAQVVNGYPVYCNGIEYNCTVRTTSCAMLTDGSIRCFSCNKFRAQLRVMYSRHEKGKENTK